MPVQAFAISCSDSAAAGRNGPEEQILGRVSGDHELGEEDELCFLPARLLESRENALAVAVQVADDGVDLSQCEPHQADRSGFPLSGKNRLGVRLS